MAKNKNLFSSTEYSDISRDILKEDPERARTHISAMNNIRETKNKLLGYSSNDKVTTITESDKRKYNTKRIKKLTSQELARKNLSNPNRLSSMKALNELKANDVSARSPLKGFMDEGASRFALRGEYRKLYHFIPQVQKAFSMLAENVVSPDDYTKKNVIIDFENVENDTNTGTALDDLKIQANRLLQASGLMSTLTDDLVDSYKDGPKYISISPITEVLQAIRENDGENNNVIMEAVGAEETNKLFKPIGKNLSLGIEMEDVGEGDNKRRVTSIKSNNMYFKNKVNNFCLNVPNIVERLPEVKKAYSTKMASDGVKSVPFFNNQNAIKEDIVTGVSNLMSKIDIFSADASTACRLADEVEMESVNNALRGPSLLDMEGFDSKITSSVKSLGSLLNLNAKQNDGEDITGGNGGKINLADAYITSDDNREIKGSYTVRHKTDDIFPIIHKGKTHGYIYRLDDNSSMYMKHMSNAPDDARATDSMLGSSPAMDATFFDALATSYGGRMKSLGGVGKHNDEQLNYIRDMIEDGILNKLTGKSISFQSDGSLGDMIIDTLYNKSLKNRGVSLVYIPADYMIEYCAERDEDGYPMSMLHSSMFQLLLWLSLYINDHVSRIERTNDLRLWEVEVGTLPSDESAIVGEFMKDAQSTSVSIGDLDSVDNIFNKLGKNRNDLFTAKSGGETIFDTNTLPGQQYDQEDMDFEKYSKALTYKTGIPASALNSLGEHEYARSLKIQVGEFFMKVLKHQQNPSEQLTKAAKLYTFNENMYELRGAKNIVEEKDSDMDIIEASAKSSKSDSAATKTEKVDLMTMIGYIKRLLVRLLPPANVPITNQIDLIQSVSDLSQTYVDMFIGGSTPDNIRDEAGREMKKSLLSKYYKHVIDTDSLSKMADEAVRKAALEMADSLGDGGDE